MASTAKHPDAHQDADQKNGLFFMDASLSEGGRNPEQKGWV